MSKKKYTYAITIRTVFQDTLHIEASNADEAAEIAIERFGNYAIHDLEPETEVVTCAGPKADGE